MSGPSFVVFAGSYDAADFSRLLGTVVIDPCRPLDNYAPALASKSPLSYIDEYRLNVSRDTVNLIKTKALRETSAATTLVTLFSLGKDWAKVNTYELKSDDIKTFSIEQKPAAFESLKEAHGDELDEFLRKYGPTGYMLVGFKSANNPDIKTEYKVGKENSAGFSTEGIVTAATGIPFAGDVGIEVSRSQAVKSALQSSLEGERVFAGQYIKITLRPKIQRVPESRKRFRIQREPLYKGMAIFPTEKMVFSDSSDDSDGELEAGEGDMSSEADILY
ncbi:hypothetical protein Dda_3448 [Drechslerella dactyloides]|uniref:Uncharacterized protein n=1 Tax=Drechslerella dactyloides TaxID=74499 RepID=A0AAD6J5S6_DREDA|nr:hypothetical protein Dda_3448 [Drechslerella dactyloides]